MKSLKDEEQIKRERARERWRKLRTAILGARDGVDEEQSSCDYANNNTLTKFPGFSSVVISRNRFSDTRKEFRERLVTIRISKPRQQSQQCEKEIEDAYSRFVFRVHVSASAQLCLPDSQTTANVSLIAAGNAISTAVDVSEYLTRRAVAGPVTLISTSLSPRAAAAAVASDEQQHHNVKFRAEDDASTSGTSIITIHLNVPNLQQAYSDDDSSSHNDDDDNDDSVLCSTTDNNNAALPIKYDCIEYIIPASGFTKPIRLLTRERTQISGVHAKMNFKELVSQRYVGVDNTGNARVWDSASVLAYCLLSDESFEPFGIPSIMSLAVPIVHHYTSPDGNTRSPSSSTRNKLRVIELGCGMAGIAGLALASLDLAGLIDGTTSIELMLTDGHPDAVYNNIVNTALTCANYNVDYVNKIRVQRLLWKANAEGARECGNLTRNGRYFQLCLISDCVFFEEYHGALIATIGRILDVNGLCILCQPSRGNSLERFVDMLNAINADEDSISPLFTVSLLDDYNTDITKAHKKFREENGAEYLPSKHFPKMLILRKLRSYDEGKDTYVVLKSGANNNNS